MALYKTGDLQPISIIENVDTLDISAEEQLLALKEEIIKKSRAAPDATEDNQPTGNE